MGVEYSFFLSNPDAVLIRMLSSTATDSPMAADPPHPVEQLGSVEHYSRAFEDGVNTENQFHPHTALNHGAEESPHLRVLNFNHGGCTKGCSPTKNHWRQVAKQRSFALTPTVC